MSTQSPPFPTWPTVPTRPAEGWRRLLPFVLGSLLFLLPLLALPWLPPEPDGPRWMPRGLRGQTVRDLRAASSGTLPVLYARTATNLWRSRDSGYLWVDAGAGLPRGTWGQPAIETWAIGVATGNTLYASVAERGHRRLYVSTDGGENWMAVASSSMLPGPVLALVAADGGDLYLASPQGLHRSDDGGHTWTIGNPWPHAARPWRVAAGAQGVLYAATRGAGLLVSDDRGESWQALLATAVTAWDFAGDWHYVAGDHGAFRSDDGGRTWQALPLAPRRVASLAVDPLSPQIVYAALSPGGVWRSIDGGASWQQIGEGLEGQTLLALALDPTGQGQLFGAPSDGVWLRDVAPSPLQTPTQTSVSPTAEATVPVVMTIESATPEPTATQVVDTSTPSPTPSETLPGTETAAPEVTATAEVATPTPALSPTRLPARPTPTPMPTTPPTAVPTPEPSPISQPTPVQPTATAVPPTKTPVPPTPTSVPPTATSVPPTATPVPPTATPVPPTATPDRVHPTPTEFPTPPPR
ncbi:MAG: hypothetical protein IT330_16535 [Anaerolineae bacterium]|nr:hypothetical protein [Anaerolineae bacterium]